MGLNGTLTGYENNHIVDGLKEEMYFLMYLVIHITH